MLSYFKIHNNFGLKALRLDSKKNETTWKQKIEKTSTTKKTVICEKF